MTSGIGRVVATRIFHESANLNFKERLANRARWSFEHFGIGIRVFESLDRPGETTEQAQLMDSQRAVFHPHACAAAQPPHADRPRKRTRSDGRQRCAGVHALIAKRTRRPPRLGMQRQRGARKPEGINTTEFQVPVRRAKVPQQFPSRDIARDLEYDGSNSEGELRKTRARIGRYTYVARVPLAAPDVSWAGPTRRRRLSPTTVLGRSGINFRVYAVLRAIQENHFYSRVLRNVFYT